MEKWEERRQPHPAFHPHPSREGWQVSTPGQCREAKGRPHHKAAQGTDPAAGTAPALRAMRKHIQNMPSTALPSLPSVRGWGEAQAAASYCFTLIIMTPYKENVKKTCLIQGKAT